MVGAMLVLDAVSLVFDFVEAMYVERDHDDSF